MENKTGQKLTEEEMKAYTPNLNLQLTLSSEVNRLRKVVEEKNELIAKFKEYDTRRSDEFRRLQQNYKLMEERFEEFNDAIDACGEINGNREFYKNVINRLYVKVVDSESLYSVICGIVSRLDKMKEVIGNLECAISCVGNAEKRLALQEELKELLRLHRRISTDLEKTKKYLRMLQ